MVKHTDDLLITKVWLCCFKKKCTLGDITRVVYGNDFARNEIHVYKVLEELVKDNLVVTVDNGGIVYRANVDGLLSMLVENNYITQIGKDRFVKN